MLFHPLAVPTFGDAIERRSGLHADAVNEMAGAAVVLLIDGRSGDEGLRNGVKAGDVVVIQLGKERGKLLPLNVTDSASSFTAGILKVLHEPIAIPEDADIRQVRPGAGFAGAGGVALPTIGAAEVAYGRHLFSREPLPGVAMWGRRHRRRGEPSPANDSQEQDTDRPGALTKANCLPAVDKRRQEKQHHGDARQHHAADDLQRTFEIFQQLKQKKEVPLGTRDEGDVGRIGKLTQRDANRDGERKQNRESNEDGDRVLEDLTGVELDGRGSFHRSGRDAVAAHQIDVEEDQQCGDRRKNQHVGTVEAGKRDRPYLAVLAAKQRQDIGAHERSLGGDLGGHHRAPVRPVVPRQ